MTTKRFLLMMLVMLLGVTGAWALDNVPYVDANGQEQKANNVTVIDASSSTLVTWHAGWYVVQGDVTLSDGAACSGNVHLILADGAKLTATGGKKKAGIKVLRGQATLTIYGQTAQTGVLNATGYYAALSGAGIGGQFAYSNGPITINGGVVNAKGGAGSAGIGGAFHDNPNVGTGEDITINGGTVNAHGGVDAAGIGGGERSYGKNITINGGKVTAIGGNNGAGIGGGWEGTASDITINGGEVIAQGGLNSMGIGCGVNATAATGIYVADGLHVRADNNTPPHTPISHAAITEDIASSLNGKIYVRITSDAHVLGVSYIDTDRVKRTTDALLVTDATEQVTWDNGWYIVYDNITLSKGAVCHGDVKLILADGAKLTTTGADNEAGISVSGAGNTLTIYGQTNQDGQLIATGGNNAAGIGGANGADGSDITILGGIITATGGSNSTGIGGGAGASASNIYVDVRRTVRAGSSANPVEEIAHTLTTDIASQLSGKRYVKVVHSTYMYNVQYVDADGALKTVDRANFIWENMSEQKTWEAGWYAVYGNVTYSRGIICNGDVHLILLDGAQLTATGTVNKEAGIRVVDSDNSLTIYGQEGQSGQLVAKGGYYGAGIGGVPGGDGNNITINGGNVTANGGPKGAGIGGGYETEGKNITINGGVVIATGNANASGIGGGENNRGSDITINGGNVTANGGLFAAGIGGGYKWPGSNIVITGGIVTANGGFFAAGIGGGRNGLGSHITISGGIVKAIGGHDATCIGGGSDSSGSNIFVGASLLLMADNNNPPTTEISHNSDTDLASQLNGKLYATAHVHQYAESMLCDADNYTCKVCGYIDEARKAQYDHRDYMNMTAVGGDMTIGMEKVGNSTHDYTIQVSEDGNVWSEPMELAESTVLATIPEGETYYFRHGSATSTTGISYNDGNYWSFIMDGTGTIEAGGNIMSLLDATCQQTELPMQPQHVFTKLFLNCEKLTVAPRMDAITSVPQWGFVSMFSGTGIKVAPTLNATYVRDGAYRAMFENCKELVSVPALAATTLERCACWEMFKGCDKLTRIEIANINRMTVEEGSTGRENSFHDLLAETAIGTNGVIVASLSMVGDARITLPSNWQWATKLQLNEDPDNEGNFYTTFYDSCYDYTVAEGHKAYSGSIVNGDEEDELLLTPTPDNIIPKGDGVILHGGSGEVLLTVSNGEAENISSNVLTGSDSGITAPANCYILSYGQNGLGFYKYATGSALAAHKAYMIYNRLAGAKALRMVFDDGEVTGIKDPLLSPLKGDDVIYNLNGMRLNKLQKGINIVNGKKIIVK